MRSGCGLAVQLGCHLPFLLGDLAEVECGQRLEVVDGEEAVVGPLGDWVADEHQPLQALAAAKVVDLREVLDPVAHEEQVLEAGQVLAEPVDVLDPVVVGNDGAEAVEVGEVAERLQLVLAEIDALVVVLRGGGGTRVAAVLLMADRPLPRRVSYRYPNWLTKLGELLMS